MKNYYKLITQRLFFIYVVYTLLFTMVAYTTTLLYTKNDYIRKETKRAEQLAQTVESQLSTNVDTANILSRHEYILKYSQMNDSNFDALTIHKACTEMKPQSSLSNNYGNIAIINVPNRHVLKDGGAMSYEYFKTVYSLNDTEIDQYINSMYSENKTQTAIFTTSSTGTRPDDAGPFLVCVVACQTDYDDKPVICTLFFDQNDISKSIPEGIINAVYDLSVSKGNVSLAYDEENKKPITDLSNKVFGYKKIADYHGYSIYWGNIESAFYVPYIKYFLHINSFLLLIFLLVLIFAFAGFVFIKTNASKMYSPIKSLMKILPADYMKSDSGDLSAFEKYVMSLESQRNIMSDIISKTKIELSDKFLTQLITRTLSKAEIRNGIISYNMSSVKFPLTCFILTYKNYQDLKNILSFDGLNEVRTSIHDIVKETFKEKEFFKLIDVDSQTIAAVSSAGGTDFTAELKRAALNVEMMLDIDVVIFTGVPVMSWYDLPDSYSSAMQSKNKYVVVSEQNIVFSPTADNLHNIEYTPETENALLTAVTSANTQAAIEQINDIVDRNMTNTLLTREQFSHFVVMLYSTIIKLITAINKTEKELFDDMKIYLELIGCQNAEALKSKLTYFITTIIQSITSTQKFIASNAASSMIAYIENNYSKDISLFSLADYMNVSQSYASKIFKQQIGENFKDYLSNVRLEKALEMIKENPYKRISDIAKSVGYVPSTMTRAFVNKYGKSPSDFVKEYQKKM